VSSRLPGVWSALPGCASPLPAGAAWGVVMTRHRCPGRWWRGRCLGGGYAPCCAVGHRRGGVGHPDDHVMCHSDRIRFQPCCLRRRILAASQAGDLARVAAATGFGKQQSTHAGKPANQLELGSEPVAGMTISLSPQSSRGAGQLRKSVTSTFDGIRLTPLTWWRTHLGPRWSRLLARLWPWLLIAYVAWIAGSGPSSACPAA